METTDIMPKKVLVNVGPAMMTNTPVMTGTPVMTMKITEKPPALFVKPIFDDFVLNLETATPVLGSVFEGHMDFKTNPNLQTVEGQAAVTQGNGQTGATSNQTFNIMNFVGSPVHSKVTEGAFIGRGSFGSIRRCSVVRPNLDSFKRCSLKDKMLKELIAKFTVPHEEIWAKKTIRRNPKEKRLSVTIALREAHYIKALSEESNRCVEFKKMGKTTNKCVEFYLEVCDGDLQSRIPEGGLIKGIREGDEDAIACFKKWATELALAINDCHTKGVKGAHLDIKPANILIRVEDDTELLVIADLGGRSFKPFPVDPVVQKELIMPEVRKIDAIADLIVGYIKEPFMIVPEAFTHQFASPEMALRQGPIDGRKADSWMIGSTMWNCLMGKAPMNDDPFVEAEILLCRGEQPEIPMDLPQDIQEFFNRCFLPVDARPTPLELAGHFEL